MQRIFLKISAVALLMNLAAYGQSLGDVARENREKQNAEAASGIQPKVFTNQDLQAYPEANPGSEAESVTATAATLRSDDRPVEQSLAEQRSAERWKTQILAKESKIAYLQGRINVLSASIHSTEGVQYFGRGYRYQARQLERIAMLQQQLDEQKRMLDLMQDAARHAGMHTLVYDP